MLRSRIPSRFQRDCGEIQSRTPFQYEQCRSLFRSIYYASLIRAVNHKKDLAPVGLAFTVSQKLATWRFTPSDSINLQHSP